MRFYEIVFGELDIQEWLGFGILFLIGATIRYLIFINNRENKEIPFSRAYFIHDNWGKISLSLLCMFVLIRFYPDFAPSLVNFLPISENVTEPLVMLLLGIFLQTIIIYAVRKIKGVESGLTAREYIEEKSKK